MDTNAQMTKIARLKGHNPTNQQKREPDMTNMTVNIDLVKNTFSLHVSYAQGKTVLKRTV